MKKYLARLAIILGIALFIELFIFNFRHWESLTFADNDQAVFVTGGGIAENEDGTFSVTDSENAYIEFDDIDKHVGNLYLDLFLNGQPHSKGESITIQVYETDAANSTYWALPESEIVFGVPESEYITLHLIGDTSSIRVFIKNYDGHSFSINGADINKKRPLIFRASRFIMILIILGILAVFRPGSKIWRNHLDFTKGKQKIIIGAFLFLNLGIIYVIWHMFYDLNWQNTTWLANLEYNYLTHSIMEGHTWLDFEAPSALLGMANPYDTSLRGQVLNAAGQSAITDFAYYNGRYYSYFGIVPVILFYLPFYLITGRDLSTGKIICIVSLFFVISVFAFFYVLIRKHFKNVSLGIYLLLSSTFIAASGITYCVQMPSIYSLPIALGITFDIAGLACWMMATNGKGEIKKGWLVAGSILMALVMGCRPQLCIAVLFAFVIFWDDIRERRFFSLHGFANTACVIMPYLIIGIGVLFYNYIRFENPFDFGATYNLTGFDMTHRGFIFDRFWLGFYEYLFQPFRIGARFPYFSTSAGHMGLSSDFQGQVINEPLMGGYFAYNVMAFGILGLWHYKKTLKQKKVLGLAVLSLLSGLVIVAVDIQMVGMTLRYLTDFSIFITMAAWIVILNAYDYEKISASRIKILTVLGYLDLFICYFSLLADGRYNQARSSAPYAFYFVKYVLSVR